MTWSLTHFCLTEKRTFCCKYICVKVRCWYLIGKWNCLSYLVFSLGVVQNFRPNSRPLNSGLEKNALHIWIQNDLSFSKLFEIWKSDKKWQLNNPSVLWIMIVWNWFSSRWYTYFSNNKLRMRFFSSVFGRTL